MAKWGKHKLTQFKGKNKGEKLAKLSHHCRTKHKKEYGASIRKGQKKAKIRRTKLYGEDLTNPLIQRILLSLARAIARRAGVELARKGQKRLSDRELSVTRELIRSALTEVEKGV